MSGELVPPIIGLQIKYTDSETGQVYSYSLDMDTVELHGLEGAMKIAFNHLKHKSEADRLMARMEF
jgi:hypothetical protein